MNHAHRRPAVELPRLRTQRCPLHRSGQSGPEALLSNYSHHGPTSGEPGSFDGGFPDHERLPDQLSYTFHTAPRPTDGVAQAQVFRDGKTVGDALTDAAEVPDGYRLHDIFHLTYATILGWSPVTRALLDRKRRSQPAVDENEDGGRAVVTEEGIAALVFAHASRHNFFRDSAEPIDEGLLRVISDGVTHLEVRARSTHDWELAIRTGFGLWHQLIEHDGCGTVHTDRPRSLMIFEPPFGPAAVHRTHSWAQPSTPERMRMHASQRFRRAC